MKLYPLILLFLPLFVTAQTIPYQLDFLDVNPDAAGRDILELAPIGNRIYWATDDDINYLSNGSVESTIRFQGGLGLRDGIVPLGNIGDLYYFHYHSGRKRYNFVINAIIPVPETLELPLLEAEKFVHTEPVMAADKLYAVRERADTDHDRYIVQLIETDLGTQESTIVVADTITGTSYPTTESMTAVGDQVYFTRPQGGGVGPAVYDAAAGTVTNLATLPALDHINYERVGDHVLLRYMERNEILQYGETYFLTPSGIGAEIGGGMLRDQSMALPDALVGVDTNGMLFSHQFAGGNEPLLANIGTQQHDHARLFKVEEGELLFYRLTGSGKWRLGRTDGTPLGTRDAVELPTVAAAGPAQTVRLGNYLALISERSPVYLYDPRNDQLQEVAADFDRAGPNPPLAALGDRLYFAARAEGRGQQLHYLTIDGLRTLSGTAYDDRNDNGQQDEEEPGIENLLITVAGPGEKQYLYTDAEGGYALAALDGETYTVTAHQPDCYQRTSATDSYLVTVPTDAHQNLDFGYALQAGGADLTLYFNAGRVRCNTEAPFWITVRNDGCLPLAGTATIKLQDNVSFVSVARDTVLRTDTTITLTFDTLRPGELYHNTIKLQLPSEEFVGDTIELIGSTKASYKAQTFQTDTVGFNTVLRCAYDPNDKQVLPFRPDATNSNYTLNEETLTYTIRFENMGNDTAFAVRIEDRLSEHLDYETLQPVDASHPYEFVLADDGLLTVSFPGIELVDTSVDAIASQGFVTFTINPQPGLPEFTRIENTAGIFFDFNRPVITNTVVSTIVDDLDKDDDGVNFWLDCDDTDPTISPLAKEVANNDIDENCDGVIEKLSSTRNPLAGELAVFPNPADRFVQLRYSSRTPLQVRLFDLTGRPLRQTELRGQGQLDVTGYPAGVYLLRVVNEATGGTAQHRMVLRGQ